MKRLTDTSPEAERVLAEAYRRMSPARKWDIMGQEIRLAPILHAAGVRLRNPAASPQEMVSSWVAAALGAGPWGHIKEIAMTDFPVDQLDVIREVLAAFAKMGIPHALGGSFASSMHGSARYTRDADIAVEPFPGREDEFVAYFGPEYYVSPDAVRQAVRERSTFNIIKPASGFKVDVFVRKDRPFELALMARRTPSPVLGPGEPPLDLVSAEDIILLKLEWFRLGGEISDRQWSDVLGVLRVQADKLDQSYLDHWAPELGVADLLARARDDAAL